MDYGDVGTWVSNGFNCVAIWVSLKALRETRRLAAEEVAREDREQQQRMRDFCGTASGVIARAIAHLGEARNAALQLDPTTLLLSTNIVHPLLHRLGVVEEAIIGLRMAAPFDADLAIELSNARKSIDDILCHRTNMLYWAASDFAGRAGILEAKLAEIRRPMDLRATVKMAEEPSATALR